MYLLDTISLKMETINFIRSFVKHLFQGLQTFRNRSDYNRLHLAADEGFLKCVCC